MSVKLAPNGKAYLNVGCGYHFSDEWNNLDLHGPKGVVQHDLRKALPFAADTFDAAYSSHVLEHLDLRQGEFFLREQWRVLKPGGVCRVVVPDLERLCRDYLQHLETARQDPGQMLNYRWTVLFLLDQLVREDTGGEMLRAFENRDFDEQFVRSRIGDEALPLLHRSNRKPSLQGKLADSVLQPGLKTKLKRILGRDARGRGEAHRWMYDCLSLQNLMTKIGFSDYRLLGHLDSRISGWDKFKLDTAKEGSGPRKPDSLFAEAIKAAPAP